MVKGGGKAILVPLHIKIQSGTGQLSCQLRGSEGFRDAVARAQSAMRSGVAFQIRMMFFTRLTLQTSSTKDHPLVWRLPWQCMTQSRMLRVLRDRQIGPSALSCPITESAISVAKVTCLMAHLMERRSSLMRYPHLTKRKTGNRGKLLISDLYRESPGSGSISELLGRYYSQWPEIRPWAATAPISLT